MYFVLYYFFYYEHDEEILDSFTPRSYLRYKKGPNLDLPPSPLFVATPLGVGDKWYLLNFILR